MQPRLNVPRDSVLCAPRASEQLPERGGAETTGASQGTQGPSPALHPPPVPKPVLIGPGGGAGAGSGYEGPVGWGLPGEAAWRLWGWPKARGDRAPFCTGTWAAWAPGVGLGEAGLGAFWGAFLGASWGGPGEGLELTLQPPELCLLRHTTQGTLSPQA